MTNSMREMLRQDMQCEGLLECFHGLTQLDKECFQLLVESGEQLTVDEVAEQVDRERSTVYRSIQRLVQTGFVQKEQINYDEGGYYHVFYPTDADEIADEMQQTLDDWYDKIDGLVDEFRPKYDQPEMDEAES